MRWLTLALVVLAGLAAACGGGGGPAQPAGSTRITMSEYRFEPMNVSATAGRVVFFIDNKGSAAHDMVITEAGGRVVGRSELVQSGSSSVFTVAALPAGAYKFYCDVPGHKDLGMVGTLTAA